VTNFVAYFDAETVNPGQKSQLKQWQN